LFFKKKAKIHSTWQIFFYAFRPMVVRFMAPTYMLGVNWLVQLTFNARIFFFFFFFFVFLKLKFNRPQ